MYKDFQGSFLGFKLTLCISLRNPLLFYFVFDFKKVKLINIYFGKLSVGRDFWFKFFGKKVFSPSVNTGGPCIPNLLYILYILSA